MNPTVALPGSMTWMGIRLSSGSRCPQSPKGLPLHLLNRFFVATVRVLETRQELTGADRAWAEQYAVGDVLHYSRGRRVAGVNAGEYATVADTDTNLL